MCVEGIGKINLVVQINGAGDTDIRAISSVINLLDRAFGQVGILAIKGSGALTMFVGPVVCQSTVRPVLVE